MLSLSCFQVQKHLNFFFKISVEKNSKVLSVFLLCPQKFSDFNLKFSGKIEVNGRTNMDLVLTIGITFKKISVIILSKNDNFAFGFYERKR
jgi:hypothetical protein